MKVPLRLPAILLLSALGSLAGDLTLTMKGSGKYNEGMQTQLWSSKYMRLNNPGMQKDHLMDYEKGVSYTIDHKKKVIEMSTFDDLEAVAEASAAMLKDLPPMVLKMMPGGDAGGEISVEDQGKEVVAGRTCRKWVFTSGGKTLHETSNDPSLKIPVQAGAYQRAQKIQRVIGAMGTAAAQMAKLGLELSKIQGVPLKYKMTMPMIGEIGSEAIEVKEGAIPDSAFALPDGYKTEDTGKKLRAQMSKGR
jgi:hypothetical protein